MNNESLNHYGGYSFMTPLYTRNQPLYTKQQTGYQRPESPDEGSSAPESYTNISPVSSGYGSFRETPQTSPNESKTKDSPAFDKRFMTYDFIAYKLGAQDELTTPPQSADASKDAKNDSHGHTTSDSTESSVSPQPSSATSSPSVDSTRSSPSPVSKSRDSGSKPAKKNARTAYTNEQIQTLLKIFHENPYPDSEHMERIAMDFGVAENKIKIWFQNKRARWRRRVNNNTPAYPQQFMPTMSPMLSPVGQYGYMPSGPYMTSSPLMMPGYLNYAAMQAPYNNVTNSQTNAGFSRLQPTYPATTPVSQYSPMTSMTSNQQLTSSLPYSRTSPPLSTYSSPNYHGLLSHYSSPS